MLKPCSGLTYLTKKAISQALTSIRFAMKKLCSMRASLKLFHLGITNSEQNSDFAKLFLLPDKHKTFPEFRNTPKLEFRRTVVESIYAQIYLIIFRSVRYCYFLDRLFPCFSSFSPSSHFGERFEHFHRFPQLTRCFCSSQKN